MELVVVVVFQACLLTFYVLSLVLTGFFSREMLRRVVRRTLPKRDAWHNLQGFAVADADAVAMRDTRAADQQVSIHLISRIHIDSVAKQPERSCGRGIRAPASF